MAFAWHNLKLNRNKTGCIFQLIFVVFDIGFTFGCQAVFDLCHVVYTTLEVVSKLQITSKVKASQLIA